MICSGLGDWCSKTCLASHLPTPYLCVSVCHIHTHTHTHTHTLQATGRRENGYGMIGGIVFLAALGALLALWQRLTRVRVLPVLPPAGHKKKDT